jgi:hypothetical protein
LIEKGVYSIWTYFIQQGNSLPYNKKGGVMDPKLVRQFIIFLVILFGWTVIVLLLGCK